ncbi:zinc-dependent metalloprotease [Demequina mangrovi]|uniref:Putative hydrolase n=1 Tax=Demequina mangrovi TaxID=1043493 RepID=A0A1H6X5K1_9MICO|nr:zinc-dependent metalloprotease [Demequina mangrovi]SEJ19825.1 putative hydrolase [Demequina mangrovi]
MSDESTPWMRLLRELFGDDAEAALEELTRMGMDPDALAAQAGLSASPAMMEHVLSQIRGLIAQSSGEDVNWGLAHDVARGVASQGGDPSVSAAQASVHRAAISRAELWLDAVTDFDPTRLEPRVWSRAEWVEATLPTWRTLAGPVAVSVSHALGGLLEDAVEGPEIGAEPGTGVDPGALLRSVSPTVCGMHLGQAAGEMAREAFGATDLGVPLLAEPRVVMVPTAITEFASGLDIEEDAVRVFLALREAAHVRLFAAAPWLPGQLHTLIERYAQGITIDLDALEDAVRDAGMGDPARLQKALNRGIFQSHHSDEQKATLESIESLLALVEGWVDDVTMRAAAPHLPDVGALREMMRRRRAAGGPAEDTFANLLDLELRPRRMRDASAMWAALHARLGSEGRDEVWSHPDLLPTAEDLGAWQTWVEGYVSRGEKDDVDRELERLLGSEDA